MKGFLFNRWTQIVLRVVIGGIFVYAGLLKIKSPQEFADSIAAYQVLPTAFINLMALGLPVLEVAVGLMLITGLQLRLGAFSALLMILIFATALTSALARGLNIDCGCFGGGEPSIAKSWLALGRDIALGCVAWMIYTFAAFRGMAGKAET